MPPKVSLILHVRDRAALTLRTLTHLAALPDEPSFEVVVVDDASADDTPVLLASLEGDVQVLRNARPVGLPAAVDQAAAVAAGEHLVLLQDEAVPCDGWLAGLIAALDADAGAAAALPRCAALDGAFVAEAHWRALAVRADALRDVGGFAATAQPGRAEKASLMEALRETGRAVLEPEGPLFLLMPDPAF